MGDSMGGWVGGCLDGWMVDRMEREREGKMID